ncbi:hypothetical protein JVT61DRAFT_14906 [Boletus reticuloceps]|uniref:Uncharacterized protein n=1 Tax=Boletus reticuloceps TaxID=495285 RepID=A0A8I2YCK5_9AGAM|nr:hypothetical protein JVT61DRAFT_14906 [Boletus reticuloceps]
MCPFTQKNGVQHAISSESLTQRQRFAMFQQYQLQTSTGRSSPSTHPSSVATSSRGSLHASSLSNSLLLPNGRTPLATDQDLEPPTCSQPRRRAGPPSNTLSQLDESISAGVRRPRSNSFDDINSDPMQLSPQCVKRLKTYAKDLCSTLEIPEKNLLAFVESGDVYHMLVNMKASLIKYEIEASANKSNALQETLASKDFETALHNRLLSCVLSPNITAYVTDAQQHIMDFIFEHQDIFKIPAGVFDDSELKSSLRSTASRLLASIHSHLKTQVCASNQRLVKHNQSNETKMTLSIVKKTSIVDVTKSLAHASSGMELEAAHWNRMAFLVCELAQNEAEH